MTTHELIERLNIGVTWSDGKPIGAVVGEVNDPVMREAAQALSTLTDEVARLEGELADIRNAPVVEFLLGVGPLSGCHFGDPPPPGERGNFWWRKALRATLTKGEGDET